MRLRPAAPFLAAAILAIVLAACSGAKLSSVAASHPSAHASASHAVQVLQHNRNAQADLKALENCAAGATQAANPHASWKSCTEKAFPKGGVSNLIRCGLRVVITHLGQARAKVDAAIGAACGSIR